MFFAALCHCVMGVNMFACCPSGNVLFVFANKPAKLRFCAFSVAMIIFSG